jgi:hypothetical protein
MSLNAQQKSCNIAQSVLDAAGPRKGLSAGSHQLLNDIEVTALGGQVQRRVTAAVGRVHVRPYFDEERDIVPAGRSNDVWTLGKSVSPSAP